MVSVFDVLALVKSARELTKTVTDEGVRQELQAVILDLQGKLLDLREEMAWLQEEKRELEERLSLRGSGDAEGRVG